MGLRKIGEKLVRSQCLRQMLPYWLHVLNEEQASNLSQIH